MSPGSNVLTASDMTRMCLYKMMQQEVMEKVKTTNTKKKAFIDETMIFLFVFKGDLLVV